MIAGIFRTATARAMIIASMLPADEHAFRAQSMLDAQDFTGAAVEAGRALDDLPGLAKASAVRGRALLMPLLEELGDAQQGVPGSSVPMPEEFREAYDAFRLANTMDPSNAEVVSELERLSELLKVLPELAAETTVETEAATAGSAAESATAVRGTKVVEVDEAAAAAAAAEADLDVLIVGAGAAGIGSAVSLIHTFGMDPNRIQVVERGASIGTSFRMWPEEMRFISPSFNQAGWTKSFDLNSVAYGSSPAFTLHSQHPSGAQYADYLDELAQMAQLPVKLHTEVLGITPVDGVFDVRVRAAGENAGPPVEKTMRVRKVVWAAGEFQYPKEAGSCPIAGAEHCMHNSHVRSWAKLPGDDFVLIGGYESGVDAAVNLARAGKQATVLASTATWNVQTPDPSFELAPYTAERLRQVTAADFSPRPRLLAPLTVDRVEAAPEGGFNVIAKWGPSADQLNPMSLRQTIDGHGDGSIPVGADGSEVVMHTPQPPVLCTGFEGSVLAPVARPLFDIASKEAKGCLAGAPLLTKEDESTKTPGVFLCGPTVSHGELSFCFVYKFRQRFGIVANAICQSLGHDTTEAVKEARSSNMFLDDLSCCKGACGDVC